MNDYTTSDKTKKTQPYLESLQKIMFFMTSQFAIVCNWLSHATLKGYVQLHLKSRWILVTFYNNGAINFYFILENEWFLHLVMYKYVIIYMDSHISDHNVVTWHLKYLCTKVYKKIKIHELMCLLLAIYYGFIIGLYIYI
jgi:hypothetical protein